MRRKKRGKISKFEKLIYSCAIFLVVFSPLAIVFTKSTLSLVNFQVEKIKQTIETQEKTNESLKMKINELVSLSNIEEVIEKEGLSYNNNNIKNID